MPDSLIDRIREKKQQAKSLLSPWLRTTDGKGSAGAGELPFTERHRIAALKMRVLDDRKLGNAHPDHVRTFGAGISEKMQSIQDLVHFSPAIERDPSIWSQLDRVYPTANAEAPREPEQPGVMRAGTVIQKFSMTPKAGQSIESFKEQASRFSQSKPTATRSQKPALPSRSRMFSRVQEFNAGEKRPVVSPEDGQPTLAAPSIDESSSPQAAQQAASPAAPAAAQPPLEQTRQTPEAETGNSISQERQSAPSQGKRSKSSPASPPETSPALPLRTSDSKPAAREESTTDSSVETPAVQESEHQPQKPLARTVTPAEAPAEQKIGPVQRARPVSKAGEPAVSAPSQRTSAKPVQSSSEKPVKPAIARSVQTVQRQPDLSEAPRLPQAAPSRSDRPVSTGPSQTVQSKKPDPSVSLRLPQAVRLESDETSALTSTQAPSRQPDLPVATGPALAEQSPADAAPFTPPLLASKRGVTTLPVQHPAEHPQQAAQDETVPPEITQTTRSETLPAASIPEKKLHQPLEMPPAAPRSVTEAVDQVSEREPVKPELPLHFRLIERKDAARVLKPAVPEALRQVQSKPLVQPQPPLVSGRKYKLETALPAPSAHPPQMPAHVGSPFAPATVQREMDSAFTLAPSEPPTGAVSMVLADAHTALPQVPYRSPSIPAVPVSTLTDISVSHAPEAGAASSPKKTSEARIHPLKMNKGGVVQRRWEEHSGPGSVSTSASERDQVTEQTPVDLDQLASDVLPLIKRLLEIELERTSGGFH
jgi:hypothetical protein